MTWSEEDGMWSALEGDQWCHALPSPTRPGEWAWLAGRYGSGYADSRAGAQAQVEAATRVLIPRAEPVKLPPGMTMSLASSPGGWWDRRKQRTA